MYKLIKIIKNFFSRLDTENNIMVDEILKLGDETKIIIALREKITEKINQYGYDSLSETEKFFDCVCWLEGEINNGGFDQYFFNIAGDHAQETVSALQTIGANYTAELLKQSFTVFQNKEPPRDLSKRRSELKNIGKKNERILSELDEKFNAYTDPIGTLLVEYIKAHEDSIILPKKPR